MITLKTLLIIIDITQVKKEKKLLNPKIVHTLMNVLLYTDRVLHRSRDLHTTPFHMPFPIRFNMSHTLMFGRQAVWPNRVMKSNNAVPASAVVT